MLLIKILSFAAAIFQKLEELLGLYDPEFDPIYQDIYAKSGYLYMLLITVVIPLILLAAFYYLYKNPYANWLNWLVVIISSMLLVGVSIFGYSRELLVEYILNPDFETQAFTEKLTFQYALLCFFLALIIGFISSLILKPWSKIQGHIPIKYP